MSIHLGGSLVYHRTKPGHQDFIAKQIFEPMKGTGGIYGRGLYCCWDIQSQIDPVRGNDRKYGNVICEVKIKTISNFLIFNYQVSKKLYKGEYSLVSQLKRMGITTIPPYLLKASKDLEVTLTNPVASADYLQKELISKGLFVKEGELPQIKEVFGIIFKGGNDGDVCVIYHPKIAYPTRWCEITSNEADAQGIKDEDQLEDLPWHDMSSDFANKIADTANKMILYLAKIFDIQDMKLVMSEDGIDLLEVSEEFMEAFKFLRGMRVKMVSSSPGIFIFKDKVDGKINACFSGFRIDATSNDWKRGFLHNSTFESGIMEAKVPGTAGMLYLSYNVFKGRLNEGVFGENKNTVFLKKQSHFLDDLAPTNFMGIWGDTSIEDSENLERHVQWLPGAQLISKSGKIIPSLAPPWSSESASLLVHGKKERPPKDVIKQRYWKKIGITDVDESIEESRFSLFEDAFNLSSLDIASQEDLFKAFKSSYEKSTGTAWDKSDFFRTSSGWEFFGTKEGGVAIRKQNSGMIKLNACYGSIREIMSGWKEMISTYHSRPIWGIVTVQIADLISKLDKSFERVPKDLVLTNISRLSSISAHTDVERVTPDGVIIVKVNGKSIEKVLVGNSNYFEFLGIK